MKSGAEKLATAMLAGMQAMQAENGWTFMDLRVEPDGRVWIESTGSLDLVELAGYVLEELEDG